MKCSVCGKSGMVFRNNEKGVPADWRCPTHLEEEPVREVRELVTTIYDAQHNTDCQPGDEGEE